MLPSPEKIRRLTLGDRPDQISVYATRMFYTELERFLEAYARAHYFPKPFVAALERCLGRWTVLRKRKHQLGRDRIDHVLLRSLVILLVGKDIYLVEDTARIPDKKTCLVRSIERLCQQYPALSTQYQMAAPIQTYLQHLQQCGMYVDLYSEFLEWVQKTLITLPPIESFVGLFAGYLNRYFRSIDYYGKKYPPADPFRASEHRHESPVSREPVQDTECSQ